MEYSFGGDTGISYEELQQRRKMKMADRLRAQNMKAPQNLGEGIHAITRALVARGIDRDAANLEGLGAVAGKNPSQEVVEALMKGAPNYRKGVRNAPGGVSIVGEDGPEVIEVPPGSNILPLTPEQQKMLEQYDPASRQRLLDNPEELAPSPIDPRDLILPDGAENFGPQSSIDDSRTFQTADLDAFKMMQLQPEYGAPAQADVNTSEGQRINFLRRMMFADAALEDPRLPKAMTRMDNAVAGRLGAIGRLYTDDNYELGRLMAEQFANANLRNESGAAIPDGEVRRAMQQYFPLPNETDAQLRAKASLRREVIRSLEQALGGDAAPVVQQIREEIKGLRAQADVPDGSLIGDAPSPLDEDGWQTINGIRVRVKQ